MNGNATKAFSLTELLVVVGIIAALVALLMPAAQKMVGTGKAIKCAGNLRQIGFAIQSYAQDNNGQIVPSMTKNNTYWTQSLSIYLGAKAVGQPPPGDSMGTVYMCPVKKPNHTGITEYKIGSTPLNTIYNRYNLNFHIAAFETAIGAGGVASTFRSVRMAQITEPSKTFIAADLFGNGGGAFWMATDGELTFPHQGSINVLYLDNHVEAKNKEQMDYLGSYPYHVFWRGFDWGYAGYRND